MVDLIERQPGIRERKSADSRARLELSIAQADAGEVVSWEEAEKWIESWGTGEEMRRPEPKRR
jgi:predicted transcriptional regulator